MLGRALTMTMAVGCALSACGGGGGPSDAEFTQACLASPAADQKICECAAHAARSTLSPDLYKVMVPRHAGKETGRGCADGENELRSTRRIRHASVRDSGQVRDGAVAPQGPLPDTVKTRPVIRVRIGIARRGRRCANARWACCRPSAASPCSPVKERYRACMSCAVLVSSTCQRAGDHPSCAAALYQGAQSFHFAPIAGARPSHAGLAGGQGHDVDAAEIQRARWNRASSWSRRRAIEKERSALPGRRRKCVPMCSTE